MPYAETTAVPVDRSKSEIERILMKYGATGFMYGIRQDQAVIAFEAYDRHVKFILPLPDATGSEFTTTPTGRSRKGTATNTAYEQEVRRRWRALSLVIKAKLEAVDTGITEFDEEFLAHIVIPGGGTVADSAIPAIRAAYETGKVQALLPQWST